jgi:N-acetyldiaminopimelate deacetylase
MASLTEFTPQELINIRRDLHKIPEIGLEEYQTHEYLINKINEITNHHKNVEIRTWNTGILVMVHGTNPRKIIGWRADIDGLPVKEEVQSDYMSTREGFMHACGHDFHMTIALGLLKRAVNTEHREDMLFLFQPAEENEAGGMLMYEAGAFGDWKPTEFYGLHVNPNLPIGVIATRVGTLFAGTCEVRVTLKGKGGHAAFPHLANDMVVAGSSFIQQVQTIVSRNVNPMEGAVVTFGSFHAGTTNNVIADEAKLFGTIRTLTQEMNLLTQKRIRQIAEGVAGTFDCEVEISLDQKGYLPVENNLELTTQFMKYMSGKEECEFQEIGAAMTGEDFGYLLSKIPGTMFWLGVETPYALHHPKMNPNEKALAIAVRHVGDFLLEQAKLINS